MAETSPAHLITLPDVALKNILDQCDFLAITNLRKVCRDLRNFIEDTKPEPYHKDLNIILYDDYIRVQTYTGENPWLYPDGDWVWTQYTKEPIGCSVSFVTGDKVIQKGFPNEDYISMFCGDFLVNFGHRKSVLPDFYLNLTCQNPEIQSKFLESFQKILESRIHPMKVSTFQMVVEKAEPVLKILKFMDKNSIEEINLMSLHRATRELDLTELKNLKQWNAAKKLRLEHFQTSENLEEFYGFKSALVDYKELKAQDIVRLRNEFLQNPRPHRFQLMYETISNEPLLIDTFGQPFLRTDPIGNKKNWIFSIPDTDQIVSINLYSKFVIFYRIKGSDVKEKTDPDYFEQVWV
ncbi:hypothetical protein CAEBREN_00180 [Caenorhabditis brenneri]|uniref:F-box domain-containing protein n=1 Tax=Caenorhabditis brenneri TaxID=135651 RepID=G0N1H8_CAEBE|nr:hypothetical protein CAEBREN_00180 [Caenorhabditis brenneri]